jgi:hypothetical protein
MRHFALIIGTVLSLGIVPAGAQSDLPGTPLGNSSMTVGKTSPAGQPAGRQSEVNPTESTGTTNPTGKPPGATGILGKKPMDAGPPLGGECDQGLLGNRKSYQPVIDRHCTERQ